MVYGVPAMESVGAAAELCRQVGYLVDDWATGVCLWVLIWEAPDISHTGNYRISWITRVLVVKRGPGLPEMQSVESYDSSFSLCYL